MTRQTPRITPGVPLDPTGTPRRRLRQAGWLAALLVLILAGLFVEMELRITAPFELRSKEKAVVRSRIEGQVAEIYVSEGDTVLVSQILARLDTRAMVAESRSVSAQMDQAKARLALLELGTREEAVDEARAKVTEGQVDLNAVKQLRDRDVQLVENEVISAQKRDETEAAFRRKEAALGQAESRLRLLEAGSRQQEVDG